MFFFCLADKVAEGVDVGAFRGLEGCCKIRRVSFQYWMDILCCGVVILVEHRHN